MADKKISQLTTLAQADVAVTADFLPIVDTSATETKKATPQALVQAGATGATLPVALGAVGTPSYTFTGDLNTGLWSPAADTLAASTGGSERLRVDSSGNLGIGTASPSARLDLGTVVGKDVLVLYSGGSGSQYGLGITGGLLDIYTANTGGITFNRRNGAAFTEMMRLDSSGNLGIGTASPAGRLDVVGGTGIRVNEDGAGTKVIQVRSNFAGIAPAINVSTNDPLLLQTNNTERMRITGAGNIVAGASAALATTATDGFLYVPTCAGTPTGTPTAITGMAPIVVDTTNNKLYFYSGGQWRDAGP